MRRQVVIRVNPCTVVSQQGRDKVHTAAELAHRSRSAAAGRAQLFAKRGRIGRVQTSAELVPIPGISGCVRMRPGLKTKSKWEAEFRQIPANSANSGKDPADIRQKLIPLHQF